MTQPARILRNSALWFSEGRARKDEARRERHCVECGTGLPSRRTPYCGRRCQWRFQGHYFWDAARTYVIHRDRFTCQVCRVRQRVRNLEVDHILEIARGGPALRYENLQTLCRTCHRAKTIQFLRERPTPRRQALSVSPQLEAGLAPEWFPA
ncbi:MAG: HNH endonuclease [Thermoplasmata archaeon]|nr:HNH endonuclease [Thermoplasmata archaeon]